MPVIMAIKPKYAKMIYEGRKVSFRPPLNWCSLTDAARRGFRADTVED